MSSSRHVSAALLLLAFPFLLEASHPENLPQVPTPSRPVTNLYHGISVLDDYQCLENAAAPEVRQWVAEENARTRAYFDCLAHREGLAEQLKQLRSEESARFGDLQWRQGQ